MPEFLDTLDLESPAETERLFLEAAAACRDAACRRGSVDLAEPPGRLIASGDLHDNPFHFDALVRAAGLDRDPPPPGEPGDDPAPAHLTLHEIIHSERLVAGMDFSYRALARVAALKRAHPELVHVLLANHELAQMLGSEIAKHGVRMVDAFDAGVGHAFGDEAPRVEDAIKAFIAAMPLALRCRTHAGDILCAHSLPGVAVMPKFDPAVLERDLTDDDYAPRRGPAHLMVWGRGYDADQLEDLTERWGVSLFLLGHEHADAGAMVVPPNAVVLNSDHERGVYLPIDLADPPRSAADALARVVPLAGA